MRHASAADKCSSKTLMSKAIVLQEMNNRTTSTKLVKLDNKVIVFNLLNATLSPGSESPVFSTIENRIMQVLMRIRATNGPENRLY